MKNQPGTMKNHEKPTWNHKTPHPRLQGGYTSLGKTPS